MDSTSFALLDLDAAATLSATQPFFDGLQEARGRRAIATQNFRALICGSLICAAQILAAQILAAQIRATLGVRP